MKQDTARIYVCCWELMSMVYLHAVCNQSCTALSETLDAGCYSILLCECEMPTFGMIILAFCLMTGLRCSIDTISANFIPAQADP